MNDMGDAIVRIGPILALAMLLLVAVATVVNHRSDCARATVVAAIRALVQLTLLAGILAAVMPRLWASALFVGVMVTAAAWTSAGRVTHSLPRWVGLLRCLGPVAVPTVVIVVLLAVIGVLPATGIAIIPTAGIMLGAAMVTTSLAGRRAHDELEMRRGEVEAALSLGFLTRDARMEICRQAAATGGHGSNGAKNNEVRVVPGQRVDGRSCWWPLSVAAVGADEAGDAAHGCR